MRTGGGFGDALIMRHLSDLARPRALFLVVASLASLGPACGGSSDSKLFDDGNSLAGSSGKATGGTAATAGSSSGGVSVAGSSGTSGSSGAGGNETGGVSGGGGTSTGGAPSGDAATGGLDGATTAGSGGTTTGGSGGATTGGSGGTLMDASAASGGTGGVVEDAASGGTGGVGTGGADAGNAIGNGVDCNGTQCEPGEECCMPSNGSDYCAPAGSQCTCTGAACTTTVVTCDEPTDCAEGMYCCFTVVYSVSSTRVSTLQCQADCSAPYTEYILCDPNSPDICPQGTSCLTALLMTNLNACQ